MNDIPTPQNQPAPRRRMRTMIAIAAAAVLVAGAITAGALFRASDRPASSADAATTSDLETRLQSLVDAGYPAALA